MARSMRILVPAALLAFAGGVDAGDDKPKPTDKAPDLSGRYVIVAGEKAGRKEPEERVKGTSVQFTRDTITVFDKDKKQTYYATYKLDAGTTPWRITMRATAAPNKVIVSHGLIERRGDTVRLIYSLPGNDPPKGFKTAEGQLMFVMRAMKK